MPEMPRKQASPCMPQPSPPDNIAIGVPLFDRQLDQEQSRFVLPFDLQTEPSTFAVPVIAPLSHVCPCETLVSARRDELSLRAIAHQSAPIPLFAELYICFGRERS